MRKRPHSLEVSGSRIDFALLNSGLVNAVVDTKYEYGYKTDHSMFTVLFNLQETPRGRGYWKFNNLVLHDKEYVDQVNKIIERTPDKYKLANPADRWENMLVEIVQFTKAHSKEKAKKKRERYNKLKAKLKKIRKEIEAGSNFLHSEYKNTTNELNQMVKERTMSAAFRSKCTYAKDYEKNSKFFFSLEKSKYNKKHMTQLTTDAGRRLTEPQEILNEQRKFYEKLYKKDDKAKFQITEIAGQKIRNEDNEMINSPFTKNEFRSAVKSLKKERCPGNQGLNAEFYQFFWSKIENLFYETFTFALETGEMTLSARRGVIALIPKRSKNPNFLKHWRPLTMLNIFYKVVAKALAARMQEVLP